MNALVNGRVDAVGSRLMAIPLASSFALFIVAAGDQHSAATLETYSQSMYAAHGVTSQPGAIYGLLYTVAAMLSLLWLIVAAVSRFRRRPASGIAVAAVVINVALALAMLFATEYSEPVFPPVWGAIAVLPALVSVVVVVILWRRKPARQVSA